MEEKMNVFEKAKEKFRIDDEKKENIEGAIAVGIVVLCSSSIGNVIGRYQGREEMIGAFLEAVTNSKNN